MSAITSRCLPVLLLCACMAGPVQAWTPYHTYFNEGPTTLVHYVHQKLDMPPEFHERQRQTLRDVYEICRGGKEAVALLGEPVEPYQPLPALPEHPFVQDFEIYYGAGRGITVHTFTEHIIDLQKSRRQPQLKGDCGLLKITARTIRFQNPTSSCKIQLPTAASRLDVRCTLRAGDAEYHFRTGVPEQELGFAQASGEVRSIAGRRCRVYGTTEDIASCVEELDKLGGQTMLLLSPSNQTRAGLLLQQNAGGLRYIAQRVKLDIQVGERLFQVPENGADESILPPLPADHR